MEMSPLAAALLEAQVQFLMEDLKSPRLQKIIELGLNDALEYAQDLRLNEVVTPAMIKETVQQYAIKLQLRSAVPEIASAIAHLLHEQIARKQTQIDQLLPGVYVREFLKKAMEMKEMRMRLLDELKNNPFLPRLVTDLLMRYLHQWTEQHTPRLLQRFWQPAIADAQHPSKLYDLILQLCESCLQDLCEQLKDLDDEHLLESLLDAWEMVRHRAIGRISAYIHPADVEDFFVIIYEYWQNLRQTDFYSELLDTGIDAFFSVYGDSTLADLLADLGIRKEMMLADAMRFAPPVLRVLRRKKMLAPTLRKLLQPFYESAQVHQLLTAAPST